MATDGAKLNQLPELTTLSDATMFYAVDGGEDYHVNFEKIKEETVPEVFTPTTNGLVPHPNSGNGGKVLRGDGTWQGTFDSSNDGLVPKLGTNDKDNVLRGDGTWVTNDKLIGTGSGSLVTFDAIEAPMPTLKVSVEAKQAGSGVPSPENVRPISGWDEAKVSDVDDVDNPTVTHTTTISLGQTVYGGEVDVVNGVLKLTHIKFKPTSDTIVSANSSSWNPNYPSYYFALPDLGISADRITCISNVMNGVPRNMIQNINQPFACAVAGGSNEIDFTATQTSASDAKQFLLDNDVEFVYELKTPIIINLTPSLIKSLNGQNNLSVDCGEILEVEYQRSITEAINALEASGGGYSETSLWSNSSGVYTGSLALSDSIENYNALMFKVSNAQGWANFAFVPTSALASNNAKAGIGGGMQSAVWWFQFTRTDATHITINNNSATTDKLYQIVGVKY